MADTTRDTDGSSWLTRLIPAATFVVGLVIGAVVILLAGPGSHDSPSADATATPSASTTPGDTVVRVPAACRAASENLEQAIALLRQGVGSVKDFDPQELISLLDRLQTLDEGTRPLVRRCSAVQVTTSASASPAS